jgi:hypothetical protein
LKAADGLTFSFFHMYLISNITDKIGKRSEPMAQKKKMQARRNRRSALIRQLPQTADMLQGSLIKKYVKCGKERCRCTEGQGHGPVYYLSFKEEGATKLIYIPRAQAETVRSQIGKFKRFKQIGAEIAKINREVLLARRKEP